MPKLRIEIYPKRRGLLRRKQWSWRTVAINGEIVIPPEGYNNKRDLRDELEDLRADFARAEIVEVAQ